MKIGITLLVGIILGLLIGAFIFSSDTPREITKKEAYNIVCKDSKDPFCVPTVGF